MVELSRRDALAALATVGVVAGGVATFHREPNRVDRSRSMPESEDRSLEAHELETLIAIAHVVYPSAVGDLDAFVRTFFDGRVDQRPGLSTGIAETVDDLDENGRAWHGDELVALDRHTQERLLREVGADTAEANPDGSLAERVRYFLVNELLYALYASPTGGELVGIENPQGHPGGLDSYQRGPSG